MLELIQIKEALENSIYTLDFSEYGHRNLTNACEDLTLAEGVFGSWKWAWLWESHFLPYGGKAHVSSGADKVISPQMSSPLKNCLQGEETQQRQSV